MLDFHRYKIDVLSIAAISAFDLGITVEPDRLVIHLGEDHTQPDSAEGGLRETLRGVLEAVVGRRLAQGLLLVFVKRIVNVVFMYTDVHNIHFASQNVLMIGPHLPEMNFLSECEV